MTRKRPSDRREHEVIAIECAGHPFKVGLGREFTGGDVVEVFIDAQKVNSFADSLVSDGAILMSMLLQYGCPASEIGNAMERNNDGTPASPLGRAAALINQANQQGD